MIYPLYLPVVCALVGGFVFAVFVDAKLLRSPAPYRPMVALGATTLISAGLAWVLGSVVTADRVAPGFDVLPSQGETFRKALQGSDRDLPIAGRGGGGTAAGLASKPCASIDSSVGWSGEWRLLCGISDSGLRK